MSSSVTEEIKKNPTITAVIDGSVVNVTERTPSGVIAQRTISLREYFEGVGEIYKPYHLEKSPYFQVFGTNWTALRFWQHNTDGTITCIVEATPRLYDMSAHHIGVFDGAGSNSEGMFNKYVRKEYDELKACGRLSYDTSNSSLVAKLHMPYTIICVKLQSITSNKGRDVAYKVMKGSIMFSDKPTINLASEVYSIPLPNTYCFPYRSNADSPICWGNALDKMEFTIESTPVLIERFYGSNFNGDLVDLSLIHISEPTRQAEI